MKVYLVVRYKGAENKREMKRFLRLFIRPVRSHSALYGM